MGKGRRSGTGRTAVRASQPRRSRNQAKLVAAVALPLLVAVALIGLIPSSDSGGDDPVVSTTTTLREASAEGRAFQTRVEDAIRTFAGERLRAVIQAASEWMGQTRPAESFAGELNLFIPEAVRTRQAIAAIPALKEAPAAGEIYRDSIGLYADFGRIYLVALDPAAEPLRAQLDLGARRLRNLADKLYDQAQLLVDPAAQAFDSEDVVVRRAPEVPDWDAEGLAAGPPLAEPPPPPPEVPPEREAQRDEEPEEQWLARVRKAGLPSGSDLAAAIGSGDGKRLGALAETYLASVAARRVAPDPEGGRVRAAVVGLSFLVEAESARMAQAATLLLAGPARDRLTLVAKRLALIGENLLESDLRGPPSGFDAKLLEDTAP